MSSTGPRAVIYCRVSLPGQTTEQQEVSCRRYCGAREWSVIRVVSEVASSRETRPRKEALLAALRRREYDVLVLFKLDRWARSLREFVFELEDLTAIGVRVVSLHDSIDTSTAMGRAALQLNGVFAQLERDLLSEATRDRLAALKAMGKTLGRPPVVTDEIRDEARRLRSQGESYRAISRTLGIGYGTARRVAPDGP